MMNSRKKIGMQALKVTMASVAVSCLGVAVFAAPMTMTPKTKIASNGAVIEHRSAYVPGYSPLAAGPALQLGRATAGEEEDCVRVTRMVGPDGRIYVSRGLVCAN
ncbi:conserved hypothetical protein [Methylocella silvestris BL2]|uniref:Uncharacterized protein n=1 Tax=Methylocella silvestris (strain DSM 15510 / CIP 108128 / LMG 27833 / NCIMB 13906 / BL2) TaxID=395965 RepID=B8EP02_METSB|nr:hypothetical protein [Methylocella silvestris]ACK49240.1 conserved hypothetical protein [Methylocella silvestris BL2]